MAKTHGSCSVIRMPNTPADGQAEGPRGLGIGPAELLDQKRLEVAQSIHGAKAELQHRAWSQSATDWTRVHVACRNGNKFREPTVGTKARPAYVGADVRVADLAMATYAVAPPGRNHHMVTFHQTSGLWNDASNFLYRAGDLVAGDYRRRDIGIVLEKSVDQEHVGPI